MHWWHFKTGLLYSGFAVQTDPYVLHSNSDNLRENILFSSTKTTAVRSVAGRSAHYWPRTVAAAEDSFCQLVR